MKKTLLAMLIGALFSAVLFSALVFAQGTQLLFYPGTVDAPGLAVWHDKKSGLFQKDATTLGFTTNGVESFTFGQRGIVYAYWDDLRFPAVVQTRAGGAANITVDADEVGLVFEDDAVIVTDWIIISAQMAHGYQLGSNLFPHIHWVQEEDEVPNWWMEYRCYGIGEDPTGSFTAAAWSATAITYSSGSIAQLNSWPDFDPGFTGVSGMCDIKITRDTDNASTLFAGADPYTGDVLAKEFDIHFLSDTVGSVELFSKH